MTNELEQRIVDLESRIAFMQAAIDDLNTVVTDQQSRIDELIRQFREMREQAKQNLLEKDPSFKPPHY